MFDLPKSILKQLLTLYNSRREILTEAELTIAARIAFCSLCENLWVTRKQRSPARCPRCHSPLWNRPLINQMLAASDPNFATEVLGQRRLPPRDEGGNQS